MIKLHLTVGPDTFDLEGDLAIAELVALVTQWYEMLPSSAADDTLRALTALLTQSTTALATAMRNAATTTITTGVTDAQTDTR
jgi:hypothetical protein